MISETATPEAQAGGRQRRWSQGAGRLVGLLVALAALALLGALVAAAVPRLWGYQSYIIYGSSMEPTIKVGSLVVAKPARADNLQVGDIIVFRSPSNGTTVTHRIVAVRDEDGQRYFQTKGDASNGGDPLEVSLGDSVQQVAHKLPYAGYFVHFAKSTLGIVLLLVLPAAGLVAMQLTQGRKATTNSEIAREGKNLTGG